MFSNWVSTFLSPRSSWVLQERRQFCTSSQSQNLRSTHVIEVRISKRFVKSRVSRSMKQLGTVTLHPISCMKESWRGSSNWEENLKQTWKSYYLWGWPQSGDPIAVVHTFLILQWWGVLSWHFIWGWSPDHGDGLGIQFGNTDTWIFFMTTSIDVRSQCTGITSFPWVDSQDQGNRHRKCLCSLFSQFYILSHGVLYILSVIRYVRIYSSEEYFFHQTWRKEKII